MRRQPRVKTRTSNNACGMRRPVCENQPRKGYHLTLAQWAKAKGENEAVIENAKVAAEAFQRRVKANMDDHEARFGLVECLILQSKFAEGKELINLGATLANSPDLIRAYARKLVVLQIAWYDALE